MSERDSNKLRSVKIGLDEIMNSTTIIYVSCVTLRESAFCDITNMTFLDAVSYRLLVHRLSGIYGFLKVIICNLQNHRSEWLRFVIIVRTRQKTSGSTDKQRNGNRRFAAAAASLGPERLITFASIS